ncbi:hypothetical protein [Gordonia sp. KTR9]|uniref:hypothetical protein n=1 Tax=Gordonia sp. KTR9 TaxID=337191 RepID=UPI0001DD94C7|nr:hypothetical protein [Gordonia sp. KTR9]ADK68982.1 hypothetical protein KTR9_4901 [Gordonia sp. KTR9]
MAITISGQAPHRISPHDFPPPLTTDPADPGAEYRFGSVLATFAADHLLQPLTPAVPARAVDSVSGNAVTPADLGQLLATPILVDSFSGGTPGDTPENNAAALDLLAQTTSAISRSSHPYIRQVFLNQGLGELRLPAPAPGRVIYSAENAVSPSAKELLSVIGDGSSPTAYDDGDAGWTQFFVSLAAAFRPATLGVAMLGPDTFTRFGEHLMEVASALHASGKVSADVLDKCRQCAAITLTDLTEALRLRPRANVPTEDYSFARLVVHSLFSFVRTEQVSAAASSAPAHAALLPFDLTEVICPETIVFVNLDAHARRTPSEIKKEWTWVTGQLTSGLKVMSMKTITRLGAAASRLRNAERTAVNSRNQLDRDSKRDAQAADFSAAAPPPAQILNDLRTKLDRMATVNKSQNIQLHKKKTLARPNRRRPDNPDVPGITTRQNFKPDVHYFPDTSGSMSLQDYMDGALFLMMMAKKFQMNFYFSSHSHLLAPEILLPVKGKSVPQMRKLIESVPKVGGGNDFSLVYDFIQASTDRRRRLNVVATDFGWVANSSHMFTHPENIVYLPAFDRSSSYSWESVKSNCSHFINSMRPLDPDIDTKILGMGYAGASPNAT